MLLLHIELGTTGVKAYVERGWLVCDVDFVFGSLKERSSHQGSGLKQGTNVYAWAAASSMHNVLISWF